MLHESILSPLIPCEVNQLLPEDYSQLDDWSQSGDAPHDISYHQSPREDCDTISLEYGRTSDSFLRLMPQQSPRVDMVTIIDNIIPEQTTRVLVAGFALVSLLGQS
jgi:hypothetical protein